MSISIGSYFILDDGTEVKIIDYDSQKNDYLAEMRVSESEWDVNFLNVFQHRIRMFQHIADLIEMC